MKNICIALTFLAVMVPLNPQSSLAETIVESGDPVIDQSLKEINAAAKENLKEFARRTGKKFGVPPEVVDALLKERKMSPADAHMTINVANTSHRPVEEVADAYERDKGKGWGAIAKKMGIKPGSAEFHELKANSKSGYGDDEDTGKSKGKGKGKGKGKNK